MEKRLFFIFTVLMIFSKYTGCNNNSRVIYVQEGKVAKLVFHYPCNNTEVTLRHGYQSPFYNSENPESRSLPPNKFVLPVNQNRSGIEKCSIHLTIDPVSSDDVGTYILTVYKNGVMLPDYPRIGLRVTYPPGKVSCVPRNDYNDHEWVSLYCTAPLGTIAGHIICYQNGTRLPSSDKPIENGETLSQTIMVESTYPVYCCSNTSKMYTDICQCTDCCWDPIQNTQCTDISDPCPVPLFTQDTTLSYDHTYTDPTLSFTSEKATEMSLIQEKCVCPDYALHILIGILILVIMVFAVMYHHKIKIIKKLTTKLRDRNMIPLSNV